MESQPRRRRRPALSCQACRNRKIKCDRTHPCAHCVSTKIQCLYKVYGDAPAQTPSRPLAPAMPVITNEPITEYASKPEPATDVAATTTVTGAETALAHDDAQRADSDLQRLQQQVVQPEQLQPNSSATDLSKSARHMLASQAGLQDSATILNKTRMLGWSHWMGTAQEFQIVYACYSEAVGIGSGALFQGVETRALLERMSNVLQKCKIIAKSTKLGRPSRCLSGLGYDLTMPDRNMADKMMTLYFRNFESTYRILHEPTFLAEYKSFWNDPRSVTMILRLKILLVVAIGSVLCQHEHNDADFRDLVHQWVYAAQVWISGPMEKDRLGIGGIQIHCLTILARQVFSISGDLVWTSLGSLVHTAMQIGLHRDPKYLPRMSLLQAELRRKLWATILEMVVQSSLDSAMPPRISLDEFDTEAPANINDNEIQEATTSLFSHPRDTYTSSSIQLVLTDSLPTRLRVLQRLNNLHAELSYLEVLTLSSEITSIFQRHTSFLQEHVEHEITTFRRNMLDFFGRRFIIPLHCPWFASKARTNPMFYYSIKATMNAAVATISPDPDEGFSRLMAIGGGMFREGIRLATAAVSQELLAQVYEQRLSGTLRCQTQYRELLKQHVRDLQSLSLERVRQGETNVKSHMFLSMVLAQVEALEAGTSCELQIAQSTVDSLELCHDLLQTRASTPKDSGLTPISLGGEQGSFGFHLDMDMDMDFLFPDASFS